MLGRGEAHRADEHHAAVGRLGDDARLAVHERLGGGDAGRGLQHGAGRGRRGGARADAERARRVVQVADDAVVVHALAVAEPRGLGQHRGGGNPETVGEREPGDAGALTTDAGLVGDETAHAALKREAEGGGAGERASDDDVAHGDPRVHVGEGVQDDDATVAVLVFDLQGRRSFRSRARPLCLSAWPLCGAWWEARRCGRSGGPPSPGTPAAGLEASARASC